MKVFNFLTLLVLFSIGICKSQTPAIRDNFPVVLDSLGDNYTRFNFAPLVVDLDKDGANEIMTASNYFVYVLRRDGSYFPGFPLVHSGYILDFAVGDVNNDGSLDIAIRTPGSIDVITRFGSSLPGFPVNAPYGAQPGSGYISLYDLDNNRRLSIIAVSYDPTLRYGGVIIIGSDGSVRTGWPKNSNRWFTSYPAIGDIDRNGTVDIILTGQIRISPFYPYYDSAYVIIYKSNGTIFSNNWPVYMDSLYFFTYSGSPSVYIDPNYTDSTFICAHCYRVYVDDKAIEGINPDPNSSSTNVKIYKFGINGNVKKLNSSLIISPDLGTLCIGDINNDGALELVAGTQWGRDELFVFDKDLNVMPGWPRTGIGCWEATALIGKLKTGNTLNIVSIQWSASEMSGAGVVNAYEMSGNPLSWSPLRPYGLLHSLCLGSLSSGSTELILTASQRHKTYLHAITIPGISFTRANFPWPQVAHDRYHTNQYGFIPTDETIGIKIISSEIPVSFKLYQNYPNPFNPQTTIRFDVPKANSIINLVIYDILGRNVVTLVNQKLNEGRYSVDWDASQFSSGIYFCTFYADNTLLTTNKLILLK